MAKAQPKPAPEAPWRNRIVGYSDEAPDQLVAHPKNWRVHSRAQQAALGGVLHDVGIVQNIIVNRTTGYVLDGHLRVTLALREDQPTVPVTYVDLTEAEEAEMLATLDPIGAMAGTDKEQLAGLLSEIQSADGAVAALLEYIGLKEGVLPQILAEAEVGELPVNPVTRPGDLWLLGKHRLLCGDATAADDVAKVLGAATPNLMVTDPPYGVDYDPDWRNRALGEANRSIGTVQNDDRADWRDAWMLFVGDVAYVWHAALATAEVAQSLYEAGFIPRSQIIWAKQHFIISRGHYHGQHEPCWYAVRGKSTAHWAGGRKQATLWMINNALAQGGPLGLADAPTFHGTQKPIECMRRPILNHTKPGDDVYDPFVGSGTTIIAAQEAGRACQALDIDPAYVDLAVKRWQDYTGQAARLEASGETFAEAADRRYDAAANSKGSYDDAVQAIREKKTGQRKASRSSKPKVDQAAAR